MLHFDIQDLSDVSAPPFAASFPPRAASAASGSIASRRRGGGSIASRRRGCNPSPMLP